MNKTIEELKAEVEATHDTAVNAAVAAIAAYVAYDDAAYDDAVVAADAASIAHATAINAYEQALKESK